ncbi:MAG: hypothetical protein HQL82_01395 [Magnetococcales bacterium]|nr:hypothetical protein [Magnetococcales bacterium]
MEALSFTRRLADRFDGMISVDHVARLQERMAALDGWFLFEPGQAPPAIPVGGTAAVAHLEGLVTEILREERGVWTTMVYVQSQDDPWLIKVFHPRRAGCGCGGGANVRPWWILTRTPPEPVPEWSDFGETCALPAPGKGKSWWNRVF